MKSISHHITLLVINSLGADTQTHTLLTKSIYKNQVHTSLHLVLEMVFYISSYVLSKYTLNTDEILIVKTQPNFIY